MSCFHQLNKPSLCLKLFEEQMPELLQPRIRLRGDWVTVSRTAFQISKDKNHYLSLSYIRTFQGIIIFGFLFDVFLLKQHAWVLSCFGRMVFVRVEAQGYLFVSLAGRKKQKNLLSVANGIET